MKTNMKNKKVFSLLLCMVMVFSLLPGGLTVKALAAESVQITSYSELPNGKEGTAYTGPTPTATGTGPITWSATDLPEGLTIDPDTGIISGTPADGSIVINQGVTITASNGIDYPATTGKTITIDAAAPLITLTTGTDEHGTITEWMLRGDADRDGTVYFSSDLFELNELRQTTLSSLMQEVCDVNHTDTVNTGDVSKLHVCFKSALPDESLDFRVIDFPDPYYAIDTVTVNGNELTVPEGFNETADTTFDGVTYTVAVNRYGKVTVSGLSLAENDVQFTHKEVPMEYFMGAITSDPNTVVYDGQPHTIGRVFLERSGEELTDPADMLYYLYKVGDWYITKGSSTDAQDTGTGSGWAGEWATNANVLEFMQKTLDYFTDFNAEALEYSDVGNYYFRCGNYQMSSDPTIPNVAANHFGSGSAWKVLSVTQRPITITADDASKLADGTPLTKTTYTIGGEYGLAQGHSIQSVTMDASITDTGTTANTISDAIIVDADGNDVTANYSISYENGTLEVKSVLAPTPVKSDPPTEKVVTGNPETAADFTFILSANDKMNPMPEGSENGIKEMTRTGAGSVEFGDITFTEAATYVYTITEKDTGIANYTYDTTSYTATYVVTDNNGTLEVVRTITADGKAVDKAEFTNVYTAPVTPAARSNPSVPQTGDYSNLTLWISLLGLSCLGLAMAAVLSKKKRKINDKR